MAFHARRFYLACFALLGISRTIRADPRCAIDPKSTVTDACTSYSDLDILNHDIAPTLKDLTEADFFAYYRLNLYNKVCPFWSDENSICGNRACAVDTIDDENDIPPIWKIEELSRLEGARAQHPGPGLQKERTKQRPLQYQLGENVDESCVFEADDECDERDYCVPEDEGAASKGDYVSLLNNTEKFTGYSGPGARQVWDAIYKENCFSSPASAASPPNTGLHASAELRNIFQEHGRQNPESGHESASLDDQCIEQRAFYRIISGMHASISTHLCWEYFNQTTGEWVRNTECYKQRLHNYPERISNLYFNYALVTRAIAKLDRHLQSYTFCSGDPDQDRETKQKVHRLTSQLASLPNTFDESMLFRDPGMVDLKDDFKQRFRNVSRIMDCVGCDKCRLWGKVQTAGYGAALKVLFEFDENKNGENPHLRRTELVALINTFGRLSHSMDATRHFRELVNAIDPANTVTTAPAELHSKKTSHRSPQEVAPSRQWKPSPIPSSGEQNAAGQSQSQSQSQPRKPRPQLTVWEEVKAECTLVWRTYMMVLNSWVNLPFKLSRITIMELNRLWNFWLGLPVPPRSWAVEFPKAPSRDEL
ncbi:endoplasmic oxidoreductin-1 [Exophiala xenobiotica]|uniref:Endoplasmic oxidoreductin-1 n=1 Tax=Lithohypha guttulata TaxID=1690604 RepID=A0ABR0JYZ5_9EURO|nr:endoplasmic oxidoreductin-1 [Lithohypha guttulata]KAK5330717.1 endoplasmic oxidoreductin-1 [Exophiala xenobiotica]